ncbi:MAG TPA: extracellular solute-binding protein [Candidatus Paceibacterota bacterium]|nr:extracellular solute-binding protein [Candidatus Paceibacterota bacterium]
MSTFQIIVLGIFSSLILIGIGVFAAFGGVLGTKGVGPVVIWGTLDRQTMQGLLDTLEGQDKSFQSVSYVQKSPATYEQDLINAMAAGTGPDLFLMPGEDTLSFSDKVLTIPYSIVSQGAYQSSFVDAGDVFLTSQGTLALPFTIDPLVMYYNRDLFASAGVASPPSAWNDLLTLAPKITALDNRSAVQRSAVALGEWGNIPDAKAILAALFMQVGDTIVARNSGGAPVVTLSLGAQNQTDNPAESALRFYTEFANPTKTSYSWNRSLPSASDAFAAGDVAMYFGFASEYGSLAQANPNLRFGVAPLPQIAGNSSQVTFGRVVGLAIARSAKNVQGALAIAQKLSAKSAVGLIAGALSLPPVRRDVAVDTSGSAAAAVFVQSALISQSWLDPSPADSDSIFETMIESVVSGASTPATAIEEAGQSLSHLLPTQ